MRDTICNRNIILGTNGKSGKRAVLCAVVIMTVCSACVRSHGPESEIWDRIKAFHGDLCLGSVMGARIGLAAKDQLKKAGGEGKLKAAYHAHSCAVDGIQVAAGTTVGGRNLEVINRNEHRLELTAVGNGKKVAARLTGKAEGKGSLYRELTKKAKELQDASPEHEAAEKEKTVIFNWFLAAPDSDVVEVRVIRE